MLVAGIGATAFAINGPGGFGPGKTVELESQDFTGGGGYSGPWYNPADDTFWSYEWAGYKYHFPVRCVGNNIESVTYEIEGERSYFEIIDNTVTAEQHDNGKHVFNYTKSVTFDYDHQESIDDQRIVEIYIGFPLSEEGKEAYELALAGKNSLEASRQLNTAIEKGAAREISTSRLKLTATFADGSMQTKTYRIAPVPDFDERYEAYSDARAAFQSIEPPSSGASQQEIEKAALELERAEEDLEDIRDEQDLAVEEARAKMYAAEETYEDIDYGTENAKEELRKAYEDAVKAEDAKVEEARRKYRTWRKDCISPWKSWRTPGYLTQVLLRGKLPRGRYPG